MLYKKHFFFKKEKPSSAQFVVKWTLLQLDSKQKTQQIYYGHNPLTILRHMAVF